MSPVRSLLGIALALCLPGMLRADDLFGGVGRGSPINAGGLLSISDVNGSGVLIGDAVAPLGLTGISFNDSNQLFGSTVDGGGSSSTLVLINHLTGEVVTTIGSITDNGIPISIGDLAFQPGTSVLYGVRSSADGGGGGGFLYTIDTSTGAATFVGNTGGGAGGGIAFAPDGTLYQTGFDNDFNFASLNVLNPADASRISTLPINGYYDGLAVRVDGAIFAAPGGMGDDIFIIDPITGLETNIGVTGAGSTSDLTFFAVPEPTTIALICLSIAAIAGYQWRRRRMLANLELVNPELANPE